MKIALIHVKVVEAPDPPLGLMYVGSFLKQSGHQVKLWDEYKNDDFIEDVIDFSPQVIGFSILSSQVAIIIPIVKKLKLETGAFIVLGGIHATVLPCEILAQTKADVAVIGEGELTMFELVEKFNQGSWREIDGIAYCERDKFYLNKPREFIKDLDILPFPDYTMLDVSKTFMPPGSVRGFYLEATMHISTSRGCPNRCIYCNCPTIFGNKVRQRSAQNVVSEIVQLKKQYPKIDGLWFVDDTFTFNHSWIMEFCNILIKENLGLVWSCQTRVTNVNLDMLKKMKQSGCVQVEYGIESGTEKILKVLEKNTNLSLIKRAVTLAKEAKLNIFGTFMMGSPTETEEDLDETFKFAKSLKLDGCRFFFTTPFPGTKLYDMATENKWFSKYYSFSEVLSLRQTNPKDTTDEPLMICELPASRLIKLRAKFQNYFIWRNYFVYLKHYKLIFAMILAFLSQPKIVASAFYYTVKSSRIDTFIEHILLAWRNKKIK